MARSLCLRRFFVALVLYFLWRGRASKQAAGMREIEGEDRERDHRAV